MKIKCAAIRFNGVVREGVDHCEIVRRMIVERVINAGMPSCDDLGFVTDDGRFVGRKEALEIAISSGQVTQGKTLSRFGLYSHDIEG